MINQNRQSAAKPLLNEEGSTTIPQGSTGACGTGKRPIYLRYKFVIYKITNTKNNKFYIGSASHYDKRIGTHVSRLRRNKHDNKYLQSAWNKYGEESFTYEVVEFCRKETLINREQFWINDTNSYK